MIEIYGVTRIESITLDVFLLVLPSHFTHTKAHLQIGVKDLQASHVPM